MLPLLWVVLCATAHGAEQIDQITLERAGSDDAVNALRASDQDILRARSGDTLVLRLAVSGRYEIAIDQARSSSLGNTIIRGTTPSGGKSLMVIGADGSVRGHFERPDEVVQVTSDEDGVVTAWVEGVDVEILPINDEVIIPADDPPENITESSVEERRDAAATDARSALDADVAYPLFKTGTATIRILIYYEAGFEAVSTVADYLVELTNAAFEDSEVFARIEIVALKSVSFDSPALLRNVLNAMREGGSPFQGIEDDLDNGNADMAVTLVESRDPEETAAGTAYLGGKFTTQRFSVTRYYGSSSYTSYTFAHEIGHNLGAGHNRETYENNGQDRTSTFSYAFGYLIENVQRTIMSYVSETYGNEPRIPRFSHPAISYNGYPTGISTTRDDSAFVARALTNNRHVAAGSNEFAYEQIRYESVLWTGYECGTYRAMRIRNGSDSVVSIESRNYVRSDGSVTSFEFSPPHQLEAGTSKSNGYCRSESEVNPLGTTYTESFFRYYHPTTGELVEGPRFQWSETYVPQSEVRVAYTDGGNPIGNTVRMIPVGEQEDIAFQPDRGFALDEIKSTCEGDAISNGFRVRATADPCLLEASFSANATPPSTPIIVATDFWDGEIGLLVSVGDDGGIDITGYEATCTDGTNTYTGTSTTSPVTVSGLTNGVAYTCTVTATNSVGTSSASAATAPITPEETTTGLPIWLLYQATQ